MKKFQQIFWVSLFVFLLNACATNKIQIKESKPIDKSTEKDIAHTFYLIGDAGYLDKNKSNQTLKAFEQLLKEASKNSTTIFLGDNIYPKGYSKGNKEAKAILQAQVDAVSDFKGRTIFIPGNHDWYSGVKGLKRQEKFIEDALGKNTFLPEDGCPIEKIELSSKITLLIVDSHWYVADWDNLPNINDDCTYKTRHDFLEELESEIKKARGKTTLIALHHPMFTNGSHGGQYSFKSHLSPIPVIGTLKNLVRKTGGILNVDLQNKMYRELQKSLVRMAQQNDKTIFLSGHDHNLQYIIKYGIPQIVSGSGSKTSPTRNVDGGIFSYGAHGFAKLEVFKDGSSVVSYYETEKKDPVFQTQVFSKDRKQVKLDFPTQFPQDTLASIYTKEEVDKSGLHKFLLGERYREDYATPIRAKTVNLDTIFGGLVPVRKGGGNQSKSLRLEDKEGRQYVMRALRKQSSQYLQAIIFKNEYIGDALDDDFTTKLLSDGFTGAHPYAPFVIGDLADAIGVFHTNPSIYYVPKQNALGEYNLDFGNELYMIEEHTSEGHDDKASFGFQNELESTIKMMKKIDKDEDIVIDEDAYIKARLFDMLIGDWDRHQDQWRWIEFEEDGKTIYRPMPRDRDQAFSKMGDGFLVKAAIALIPSVRLIRSYSEDLKDVKGMNIEPYPMDVALINQSDKKVWDKQVKYIQENITDDVIEKAFKNIPVELQNENITEIKHFLKSRRENLQRISDRYYKVLNKFAVIRGTNKDDWFDVERLDNGNTKVTAYRIKGGEKADIIHERMYNNAETKEIWIYALDDDDQFHVFGEGSSLIKVRLIGGLNNDVYDIKNNKRLKVYDYKSKNNTFLQDKIHKKLTDDYETNVYNYKKQKNDLNQFTPALGYNPDDGFKVGINNTFTSYKFERNPFSSQHSVSAHYFEAINAFDLLYTGEIANVIGQTNLEINLKYNNPNYAVNFFGFGNSTANPEADENDGLDVGFDYNRVRLGTFKVEPALVWRGQMGAVFKASLFYESNTIERTEGRFISTFPLSDPLFDSQNFLGTKLKYSYVNKDDQAFQTLGMLFNLEIGALHNTNSSKGFAYVIPELGMSHKLTSNGKIVLASKLRGHLNVGEGFEFYQAAVLGDDTGLRGFRRERFSGQQAFVQSTDLRFNLKKGESFSPFSVGLYGGFDYGRVWVEDEFVTQSDINNRGLWHTSVGGGFFVIAYKLLSANLSAFHSVDGVRFSFQLGFGF
jgi:predicted RNA-binding protein with PIN domain/predicted phosphodiesterase